MLARADEGNSRRLFGPDFIRVLGADRTPSTPPSIGLPMCVLGPPTRSRCLPSAVRARQIDLCRAGLRYWLIITWCHFRDAGHRLMHAITILERLLLLCNIPSLQMVSIVLNFRETSVTCKLHRSHIDHQMYSPSLGEFVVNAGIL